MIAIHWAALAAIIVLVAIGGAMAGLFMAGLCRARHSADDVAAHYWMLSMTTEAGDGE